MTTRALRAKRLGVPESELPDGRGRHGMHATGSSHPRWNDVGGYVDQDGYVHWRVGKGHPLADPRGYAFAHRVVLAAAGIVLASDEVAHHRNREKADNRFENLQVMKRAEHSALHDTETPWFGFDVTGVGRLPAEKVNVLLYCPGGIGGLSPIFTSNSITR